MDVSNFEYVFLQASAIEKSKQIFKIRHVQIDELPRTLETLPLATKGVEVQPTMQNLAPKLTHLRVSIDVGPPTASYTMSTPLPRKVGFMYFYSDWYTYVCNLYKILFLALK